MRGATLFFIVIVGVTASGRAAAGEYAAKLLLLLASNAPYSYLSIAIVTVSALICLLIMREPLQDRTPKYLVRREVRGDNVVTIRLKATPRPGRFRNVIGLE